MDSLTSLATSLSTTPNPGLATAEAQVLRDFKAAALSITTLYRSSRRTSTRAFNAGYAAACRELQVLIQLAVSNGGQSSSDSETQGEGGVAVGKVMDWIEARLEAIRAREEEEDEDEEKEQTQKPSNNTPATALHSPVVPISRETAVKDSTPVDPKPGPSPSPPPPPTTSTRTPRLSQSLTRSSKHRTSSTSAHPHAKDHAPSTSAPVSSPVAFTFSSSDPLAISSSDPASLIRFPSSPTIEPIVLGAKRRHASMLAEGMNGPSNASQHAAAGQTHGHRRRTRSTRALHDANTNAAPSQQHSQSSDAMDVEDEGGRERKRVARR